MPDVRLARTHIRAAGVCLASLWLGCGELPEDLLVIAPPDFGRGTVTLEIVLGSGIDRRSLAIEVDGVDVRPSFAPTPAGVQGELEVGAGEHRVEARAHLSGDPAARVEHVLQFSPPAGLPAVVRSEPSPQQRGVATGEWLRLDVERTPDADALDSLALSCDGEPTAIRASVAGVATVVVDPVGSLPAAAQCLLEWRAPHGVGRLPFATAVAQPPARVRYDRRDERASAPYPDDYWLATNPDDPTEQRLRIGMSGFGAPDQWLINALASRLREFDGFSPVGHLTIPLSEAADEESLPHGYTSSLDPLASVWLIDVTEGDPAYGTRIPFRVEARTEPTAAAAPPEHALLVFPSIALRPRHSYGLIVTQRVRATRGAAFSPSRFFALARGPGDAADPWSVRRVRGLADDVLAAAEAARPPIERADVALALRFTIRSLDGIADDLLAIRALIQAAPPPSIQIDSVAAEDPGEVEKGSAVAAVVRGRWRSLDWRDSRGPLARQPDGTPRWTRNVELPFVLALPAAARKGPVPVVLYQHGNPGSAEEEVVGRARSSLAAAGFAVVGFTDVLNRETSPPGPDADERAHRQIVDIVLRILANGEVPGYFVQTVADQLAFLRAIPQLAAIPGFALLRPGRAAARLHGVDPKTPILYLGISEGAHHGAFLLPFAPEIRAAALVSPGRRFSEILIHQRSEQLLAPLAFLGFGRLSPTDIWVVLALLQSVFDDQDPHVFASHLYRDPLPIEPARRASLLVAEGLGDTLVPNHATHAWLREIGPVPQIALPGRAIEGLSSLPGPVRANVDAKTTAAFYPFVPRGYPGVVATPGCDSPPLSEASAREGHYCAQSARESLEQQRRFFESAVHEPAPVIIDPVAR